MVRAKHQPANLETIAMTDLPDQDVLVRVRYSTLNYKDALALTARSPICRRVPMVCGIDLAGEVVESRDSQWLPGDEVVVNGFGLSETEWGGYSHFQRVSGAWLVRKPAAYTLRDTMCIGTAGYTSMLCVLALLDHGVQPELGPVLVTGATGGVGSIAVMLLARLGFKVYAATGRPELAGYLKALGAADTVDRAALDRVPKPLEKEQWAGAVDCVGGPTLASVCAQTHYNGLVAACGLAGSADLPASVMPFILRGVTLRGVDSVMAPLPVRQRAWDEMSHLLQSADLGGVVADAELAQLPQLAHDLLDGRRQGRAVVALGG